MSLGPVSSADELGSWDAAEREDGCAERRRISEPVEQFRRLIEFAAEHPDLSRPLALSRTVTRIAIREDASTVLTVQLDRDPVAVIDGAVGEAESEIEIAARDLGALVLGELQLAIAIAKGQLSYRGCVRKFLRAAPILRRAARRLAMHTGDVVRHPDGPREGPEHG